ncbi:unnamed protein product [Allacma fusca]|uniref:SLC26A/SulP transporter domain-containing protein n=1 Tax=Allacma fusca TaxID=39272 RepID=A0A8J2LID8_9HEXA|nr:unnamed protein product [Allacma fusca]
MRTQVLPSITGSSSIASCSSDSVFHPFGKAGSFSLNNKSYRCGEDGEVRDIGNGEVIWNRSSVPMEENSGLRQRCRAKCSKILSKENLQKVFPIIKWAPEYSRKKMVSDIIAGLTVGLTILPQGLAYATVAGLPPVYGLYSGFVGCFVYILFGGTQAITIGPNAIQCILTWKFTNGKPPEYAVFLCFCSGVIFMLMYFLRLGFIANFISTPVISGFTSAVALTIVSTQLKGLLGLQFPQEGFLPTIEGTIENFSKIHTADALLSLVCCLTLFFLMKLQFIFRFIGKRYPSIDYALWFIATSRNAIIIIACTVMVAVKHPNHPYSIVGHIIPGLPEVKPPPFSIYNPQENRTHYIGEILSEESAGIIILPLLGLMGHMTIAKAFAGSARVEASQEMLSIGISNLISSFFSSMPIAGSFSRTTVNAMSGAESPAGGFVTGMMVILALQFLTPYFFYIPKASLASVVCCSVIFMVDLKIIRPMWKSKKMDLIPWALTVLVTLFVGLEFGIGIGLVISAMFLLYYAARPRVRILKGFTTRNSQFILVQLDRSLTFPSVDYITDVVGKAALRYGNKTTPIVIDCHHIQFADFTAATAISDMVFNFSQFQYTIVFWKLKPSILRIVSNVMADSGNEFRHCVTEHELEQTVDRLATCEQLEDVTTDGSNEIRARREIRS